MEKSQARPRSVPRPPVPGPGSPNGAHQISNLEPLHLTSSPEINCGWNLEFGIWNWGLGIGNCSVVSDAECQELFVYAGMQFRHGALEG
jgi:hypothetical protein